MKSFIEGFEAVARALPDWTPRTPVEGAEEFMRHLYKEIPEAEGNYDLYAGWIDLLLYQGKDYPPDVLTPEQAAKAVTDFLDFVTSYDDVECGAADYMIAGLAALKNKYLVSELITLVCYHRDIA